MRNIPVNLNGFKLMITEEPTMKMREKDGISVPVTDPQGVTQFVVSLFAKARPVNGLPAGKGEEIKVTLATEPGEGFEEGMYVELIDATVSPFSMKTADGRDISGLSFRAAALKPATPGELRSAA